MVGATIGAALHPRARLRRGEYVVKSGWLIEVVPKVTTTPPATVKMPVVTAVHDRLSCRTPP
jgi:hypothetical protein